jgi:hypothetical protein
MTETTVGAARDDVHTYFNLSYANYLVLPRTLLQSMPAEWQVEFVRLMRQYDAAFEHVPQAKAYDVTAEEGVDPVPYYNRGRTRIAPDLDAIRAAEEN